MISIKDKVINKEIKLTNNISTDNIFFFYSTQIFNIDETSDDESLSEYDESVDSDSIEEDEDSTNINGNIELNDELRKLSTGSGERDKMLINEIKDTYSGKESDGYNSSSSSSSTSPDKRKTYGSAQIQGVWNMGSSPRNKGLNPS